MAVPKRRHSKARAAKRRTHYTLTLVKPVRDENGDWKVPHLAGKKEKE